MSSRGTDELTPRDARRATRRSLIVQEQRSRRGAILAQRRSAEQTRRQNSRQHQANRNIETRLYSDDESCRRESDDDLDANLVRQHFNQIRNRRSRLPLKHDLRRDKDSNADDIRHGVQDFNSPSINLPETSYELKYPYLQNENNHICPHCNSILWNE